ncbi:ras GTPase-activating protein-binding protein 2 isoform X4 [Tetranychus urticae]|uniref:ras GTPase-activating protein-binding protein 2 isoform X4 n=1 Tax=Tetranychus urticae TaxID=32264 RepID=UPI00077C0162|nr:ras GTPase-activating protein-binding protein 2 isoform X4 [Tetranychus urticae]
MNTKVSNVSSSASYASPAAIPVTNVSPGVTPNNTSSTPSTTLSTISTDADPKSTSTPEINPQAIGRAFVRQYYTMLNSGPHILHRFYSDESALLHAGSSSSEDPSSPVYGQENIYKKIMSLNFKNCHTKIIHVDSLETVGNGVVIQVIGELSNDSQPMRRFLQTFVLVPRSQTNYYVRTDIFRYQDQDDDEICESEKTDEVSKESAELQSSPVNPQGQQSLHPVNPPAPSSAVEQFNSPVIPESANDSCPNNEVPKYPESNDKNTESSQSTGPSVTPLPTTNHQQTSNSANVGKPMNNNNQRETKNRGSRGEQGRKTRNENREITPGNDNDLTQADSSGDFSVRKQQFSDEQQVFVGNLLQDITEDQLRNFFSKYGNIIDVRINRTNQKQGRTPNYGFVTFDDPSIVKKILSMKPIYFDDHRFNVEEKRSQANRGNGTNNTNRTGTGGIQGSNTGRSINNSNSSGSRNQSGVRRDRARRDRGDRGDRERIGGGERDRLAGNDKDRVEIVSKLVKNR